MENLESLNQTFRGPAMLDDAPLNKRQRRALRTRERALSPVRILFSLMMVPFVAAGLTASIFIRTSDFESSDALRHLIALGGCEAAMKMQVAPARVGEPGYHPRNDPDGDGIACDSGAVVAVAEQALPTEPAMPVLDQRVIGGAKFLRP